MSGRLSALHKTSSRFFYSLNVWLRGDLARPSERSERLELIVRRGGKSDIEFTGTVNFKAEPKWWATYVRTFADTAKSCEPGLLRQRWAGRADAKGSGCSACLPAETDENAASIDEETDYFLHCDGAA